MSYQRFLVILGLGMLSITAWGGGESTATPASAPATIPTNTPTATPSPTATPTATQAPPTPPAGTPLPTATSTTAAAMAAPTATSEPPPSGATIQPSIQNFALQNLTVQVGDTIVWTQQDSTTHTTTSGNPPSTNGIWDSGFLQNSQAFSFTFTQAGTFPYFCDIHNSMTATITVVAAGSGGTTNPPEATQTSTGGDSGGSSDDEYS